MVTQIFVYGSLRKGFESPAYQYLSDYFDFVAHARVKGLLYDLGPYPAAVPDDGSHYIIGELYAIRHQDELGWALAQLDDYEGINPGDGEESLYRRSLVQVECTPNGEQMEAWIYWYDRPIANAPIIDSGDVLAYLKGR